MGHAGNAKAEAHAIPPGTMVADGEKYSAKIWNRVPHRSPGARDRWHPQFDREEDRNRGHTPSIARLGSPQSRHDILASSIA